jgi:hypothetical protein
LFVFFTITPLTLFASVVSLVAISNSEIADTEQKSSILDNPQQGVRVYASLPETYPTVDGEVLSADARPVIIREYLRKNNSPMEPYFNYSNRPKRIWLGPRHARGLQQCLGVGNSL